MSVNTNSLSPNLDETFKIDYGINSPLKAITIAELLQCECKPKEFILDPIIPDQSLDLLFAPAGVGKTFVSLNIAYAVASGGDFLGWQAPKPRGVLVVDGEMPLHSLQERMASIVDVTEKEAAAQLVFLTPDMQEHAMPNLSTEEGQEQIAEFITPEIDLIIVDNLSCLARSGRENDAESWQPIQNWILRLRASGKSVLLVHHAGKGGGGQRGTSKRIDVLDTVLELKRPSDYTQEQGARFEIHFGKARYLYGQDVKPLEVQLSTDESGKQSWLVKSLNVSTHQKVIDLANEGLSQKEIAEELGINKSNVSRHMKNAREEGLIKNNNSGGYYVK